MGALALKDYDIQGEGRNNSRQNLNEYIGTLHLAPHIIL